MSERISDEQLNRIANDVAQEPRFAAYIGEKVVSAIVLDLRDARKLIQELRGADTKVIEREA